MILENSLYNVYPILSSLLSYSRDDNLSYVLSSSSLDKADMIDERVKRRRRRRKSVIYYCCVSFITYLQTTIFI